MFGALASAGLWEERSGAHEVLREGGVYTVPEAEGFHVAALLHLTCAAALMIHFLAPRRWLIKFTDQVVDRAGLEETLGEESAKVHEAHNEPGDGGDDDLGDIEAPDTEPADSK